MYRLKLLKLTNYKICVALSFSCPGPFSLMKLTLTIIKKFTILSISTEKANDKIAKCVEKCPETCSRVTYDTRLSYGVAISDAFIRGIDIPAFDRSIFGNLTNEEQLEFFRSNYLLLLTLQALGGGGGQIDPPRYFWL